MRCRRTRRRPRRRASRPPCRSPSRRRKRANSELFSTADVVMNKCQGQCPYEQLSKFH